MEYLKIYLRAIIISLIWTTLFLLKNDGLITTHEFMINYLTWSIFGMLVASSSILTRKIENRIYASIIHFALITTSFIVVYAIIMNEIISVNLIMVYLILYVINSAIQMQKERLVLKKINKKIKQGVDNDRVKQCK